MRHLLQYCFLLIFFYFLAGSQSLQGQTFTLDGTDITTCSGSFQDSGGENGTYSPNEEFTITICPEGIGGNNIQLTFSGIEVHLSDELCFYDGLDTTANLIACADEFSSDATFIIQASAANASGCITIYFRSDNENESAGWDAQIRCVPQCQLIQAELVQSSPEVSPSDTGWIDICQNESIELTGRGLYLENNLLYRQSDSTSSFTWNFGDGTSAFGPQVRHSYTEPGGYTIQLTIQDTLNCTNTNFISQRVRVSPSPSFNVSGNLPTNTCLGDTLNFIADLNSSDTTGLLFIESGTGFFQSSAVRADSLPLPDGSGGAYRAAVQFQNFAPGQVLENINDLLGICVNMEHSWMRDLEISLTCPNGQSVLLHEYAGREGATFIQLGEPIRSDEGNIQPGVGYDYCWTPTATNPNWVEYGVQFRPSNLPAGDYQSIEPLEQLVGCPLNGEWSLEVLDSWPDDNGYIFSWGIDFEASLYPSLERFTPTFTDSGWLPSIPTIEQTASEIVIVPEEAGTNNFPFFVIDEFGCRYDTNVSIIILPPTHLSCLADQNSNLLVDTTVCEGTSLTVDVTQIIPDTTPVKFEVFPDYEFGFSNHPHTNPYRSLNTVVEIFPRTLDDPINQIESVCVNLNTDWAEDIDLFLESPSGELLELSTENGRGDDDYLNTCFTPKATDSIINGSAPFTGDFQPEGNWLDLQGSTINGDWTLLVSDGFGDQELGRLNSWSITFKTVNSLTYSWTPGEGISCTDCPNPTFTADTTRTYFLTITDVNDYQIVDSITVEVIESLEAPEITCNPSALGEVTYSWPFQADVRYDVTYIQNGGNQVTLNDFDGNVLSIDNLIDNDTIILELTITATVANLNCESIIVRDTCIYTPCDLSILTLAQTPTSCIDATDGTVTFTGMGGIMPYSFFGNNQSFTADTATFIGLSAGPRTFLIRDSRGCQDSITIDIGAAVPIDLSLSLIQEISCSDIEDGIVEAITSGGSGNYTYNWEGQTTSENRIEQLGPGTYRVTVEDDNGCSAMDSITLTAPTPLELTLTGRTPLCADTNDGSIRTVVSGGAAPYLYRWNNGATDTELLNIGRGNYAITVIDDKGCRRTENINLTAPGAVRIDSIQVTPPDCFGNSTGIAQAFVAGGVGNYEYLWNDPFGQVDSVANGLATGNYSLNVTDGNGCSTSGEVFIPQPEQLSVAIQAANVNCNGGNDGLATAIADGGNSPFSFSWDNGGQSATVDQLTAGRYEVTVEDNNGCVVGSSVVINEPDFPFEINVSQSLQGCFGESSNRAIVNATGGNGSPFQYNWSDGQATQEAVNLDSITYTITVTDRRGCIDMDTILMRDLEKIEPNIIISPPSCHGFTNGALGINFVAGGSGSDLEDHTFLWNTGETTSVIEGLQGGIEYTVTVTDPIGCTAIEKRTMTQPIPITYNPNVKAVSCFGGTDGSITLENITGEGNTFDIRWDLASGGVNNEADNLVAGTYSFTITDARNCSTQDALRVSQPSPILISFETVDNDCFNEQEGQARAFAQGGAGNFSYLWSNGDTNAIATGLLAGTYTLTATDINGCQASREVSVDQPAPFDVEFISKMPSCNGDRNGAITINVNGGTLPYVFSLDNRTYQPSNTFLGLNANRYKVFIRDQNDCLLFEDLVLNDPAPFEVKARPQNSTITIGDSIQLTAMVESDSNANFSILWRAPYDGTLSCDTCLSPFAKPDFTITYELVGVNDQDCVSSDFITINVDKPKVILVPTGFTPNDDGNNDLLIVHGGESTLIRSFQVYDRWGELIHEAIDFPANDDVNGWNGMFKNQMAQSGVYLWVVEAEFADGSTEVFKGQTTLIR